MKIVQIVPKPESDSTLNPLLKNTERQLRGPHTTFEREKEGRWKHVRYPGWIQWNAAAGGILIAEFRTRARDHEWQILEAFIGYLDRHLGDQIDSISVHYR
ncbi:MAG TPA: hypothetical protein VKD71_15725 [Gemmataceae bacterium]|nr:hypothetical protein [Gemmataceae bacterium]